MKKWCIFKETKDREEKRRRKKKQVKTATQKHCLVSIL